MHVRRISIASILINGRLLSKNTTKATSTGASSNAIKSCSRRTPTGRPAEPSPVEAVAPCCLDFCCADAAAVDGRSSTQVGLLVSRCTVASFPTGCSAAHDVLCSEQSAWMLPSHASCCVLWNRWLLRRHCKPSAGIWSYKASDDASWSWNCGRRNTRPRLLNEATLHAIPIIGSSPHSLKKAGKQHCSVYKPVRCDWLRLKRQAPPRQYPTLSGLQTTSRWPGMP